MSVGLRAGLVVECSLNCRSSSIGADSVRVEVVVSFPDTRALTFFLAPADAGAFPRTLQARARDGSPVELRRVPDPLVGTDEIHFASTRKVARGLTISYWIRPGSPFGATHFAATTMRAGHSGADCFFGYGRNLFLLPGEGKVRRVTLRVISPTGWSVMTPWRQEGPRYVVDEPKTTSCEALRSGFIAAGPFHQGEFHIEDTTFHLAWPPTVPDSSARAGAKRMRRIVRYVFHLFGRSLGQDYSVFFVPPSPPGVTYQRAGACDGQTADVLDPTPDGLHDFARTLIDAFILEPAYRTPLAAPSDYWLTDAVRNLYSYRAVASTGLITDDDIRERLSFLYANANNVRRRELDLEHLYDASQPSRAVREQIAPYVLYYLDRRLREVSCDSLSVDEALGHTFSDGRSIWTHLPRTPGLAWDSLRSTYVRGRRFVPSLQSVPAPPTVPIPTGAKNVGWLPGASLTIAYTGRTAGYLENCGCKINQAGGLARRATVLRELRRQDPSLLVLDAGSVFPVGSTDGAPNALTEAEVSHYLASMGDMHYTAVAMGSNELAAGPAVFERRRRAARMPFLACNVSADGRLVCRGDLSTPVGETRVVLIGVFEPPPPLRQSASLAHALEQFAVTDPVASVQQSVRSAVQPGDFAMVVGNLQPATIRRLVAACPRIGTIISTESNTLGADSAIPSSVSGEDHSGFLGRTLILYTHFSRYGVGIARCLVDPTGHVVTDSITHRLLDESVRDDELTRRRLTQFYDRIGRRPEIQAAVTTPFARDPLRSAGGYVGVTACAPCHAAEHAQWLRTKHASAYETLLDRHRHYQPACVSCHVVGYGTPDGFRIGSASDSLANVQCEVCHGPGREHVRTPTRTNIQRQVPEGVCRACHTPDHSDTFDYGARLKEVVHVPSSRTAERPTAREEGAGDSQARKPRTGL